MAHGMGRASNGSGNGDSKEIQVVDFSRVREKRLEEKRKNTERIFFENLLSVYSVIGQSKMFPVQLIEVSEDGCSFQVPYNPKEPWPRDAKEMPLRLYFSRETYLEVIVDIKNSRHTIEKNQRWMRVGCTVAKNTQSYPAYQQFVKFLKLYSEQAHRDRGDMTIFYL